MEMVSTQNTVMKDYAMKITYAIGSVVSLLLALWLCFASEWQVLHSWYAHVYLLVFAASVVVFLLSRCKSYLAFGVGSACGKFLGVIFLAWLRWGYQAPWMSGWLGMSLIVVSLLFYVVGLPFILLNCRLCFDNSEDAKRDS